MAKLMQDSDGLSSEIDMVVDFANGFGSLVSHRRLPNWLKKWCRCCCDGRPVHGLFG